MRLLGQLGLTTAMTVLIACSGGSVASANPIDTCTGFTSPPKVLNAAECTSHGGTVNTESTKVTFQMKATDPIILGSLNELCAEALATMVTKGDGTPGFEVTSISFVTPCTPCTGKVELTPPYSGTIDMVGSDYFLNAPFSGKLNGCPFDVRCKFGTTKMTLKFVAGVNFSGNEFRAEKETLNLEEGSAFICGSTAQLDADWKVTSPNPFFPFLL